MSASDHPAPSANQRRTWLKFLVPALSLLLSLLAVELALRLLLPAAPPWTVEDQHRLIEKGTRRYPPAAPQFSEVCTDRPILFHQVLPVLGSRLREYAYPVAKPAGTYRIIGLGDSFTWGWGIADNRRTIFKLLECWWNRLYPSRPLEVINASKPGAGVGYYQGFLDANGWRLDPDRIVISFNLNDANIPFVSLSVDAKTARRLEEKAGFCTKNSRLIRLIRARLLRKRIERQFIASVRSGYLGRNRSRCWGRAQRTLLRIAASCRQKGVALMVIVFPLMVDLDRDYPFTAEVAEIVRFCRQNGIECVDLLPTFLGKTPELLWIRPTDTHPNEVANRLAAETVFHTFTRPGFIAHSTRSRSRDAAR